MSAEQNFISKVHERTSTMLSEYGDYKSVKYKGDRQKKVLMQSWPTAYSIDQKVPVSGITIMRHTDEHYRGDDPYCIFLDRPTEPTIDPMHQAGSMYMVQNESVRLVTMEYQRKFNDPLSPVESAVLEEILDYCSTATLSELT